jgi:hypothetical protein
MFQPSPRHTKGLYGARDVVIAMLCLVAGILTLIHRNWWPTLFLLTAAAVIGREALLKYKAGNWPKRRRY